MLSLEYIPQGLEADKNLLTSWLACLWADFVIIPDSPKGKPTPEACMAALGLRDSFDVRMIPSIAASGRRVERVESLLLGLKYAGFDAVAVIGGDRRAQGDLDGGAMAKIAKEILGKESLVVCGSSLILDTEAKKSLEKKIANGARIIISQPAFCPQAAERFLAEFEAVAKGSGAMGMVGFFPIYDGTLCAKIQADSLGFDIPSSYQKAIAYDALKANHTLFTQLSKLCPNLHLSGAKNTFVSDLIHSLAPRSL
ncbi:hypothetical protein BKH46_08705 [Helicobacter sp. 12S02634-8]|uniref:hypothetical protein n=1 Tax=Helicobacter sp. 12S02634-8 TaxID=1476199 RepID=UPI000BA55F12|nr:hypothetical protein [Helicobacter sp. 12S02634-8]PAF46170.1 hypothetical protein BKH46_08705 [Helicobacter sp. 12S02634-8]